MADTYDTEPHEHEGEHDEALTHDQAGVSEPPSDYEFADDSGATADVEHSEEVPSAEEGPPRRSPILPIAAAVGGALLLGVAAWWQFGNHTPEAPPFITPTSVSSAVNHPPVKAPPPSDDSSVPSQPTAPRVGMMPPPQEPTIDTSSSPALPSDNGRTVPATTAPPPPPPVAATSFAPPVPGAVSANPDARVEELTARIDTLQKGLEQANQQLSQVTNMVAATASQPASAGAVSPATQERLDKLERQLAELRHSGSTHSAAPESSLSDSMPVVSASKSSHHKHKATHKAAHRSSKTKHQEAAEPTSWVLRAATPGHAWVAANADSHDLKQVQVGDALPGIGKVTGIEQQGSSWVVKGTSGSIQ
ncbi:MAG: hypothetical protein WCD70_09165 [Alphaproteobacteria bacterium]